MEESGNKHIQMEEKKVLHDRARGEKHQHEKMQVIVFKLGEEEYAIKIDQIKEVVLTPGITRMPHTGQYVKGVANIRGNIIAIIDLEEKFGIAEEDQNDVGQYTLVVESDELKAGILVREVPNTLTVKESQVDNSLNNGVETENESNFIKGIVKLEDRLVFLIDIFKVVTEKEFNVNTALKHTKQKQ